MARGGGRRARAVRPCHRRRRQRPAGPAELESRGRPEQRDPAGQGGRRRHECHAAAGGLSLEPAHDTMASSIFEPDGELFIPTEAALSPWSDQALHGGPPTMLMAREIERFPAEQPMFVTRITVELMRSVGRKPLAVRP